MRKQDLVNPAFKLFTTNSLIISKFICYNVALYKLKKSSSKCRFAVFFLTFRRIRTFLAEMQR